MPQFFELVHDAQPEFGTLGLLDPDTEDLLGTVGQNPQRDVHRIVADGTVKANALPFPKLVSRIPRPS